jgi:hypothetical protein
MGEERRKALHLATKRSLATSEQSQTQQPSAMRVRENDHRDKLFHVIRKKTYNTNSAQRCNAQALSLITEPGLIQLNMTCRLLKELPFFLLLPPDSPSTISTYFVQVQTGSHAGLTKLLPVLYHHRKSSRGSDCFSELLSMCPICHSCNLQQNCPAFCGTALSSFLSRLFLLSPRPTPSLCRVLWALLCLMEAEAENECCIPTPLILAGSHFCPTIRSPAPCQDSYPLSQRP